MAAGQHSTARSGGIDRRPPGLIASIVLSGALLAVLVWQFGGVADDGQQLQVLNPGLHPAWKAVLLVTLAVGLVCSVLVWARRRWTMPVALVNAAANAGGAAVIIGLTMAGALFDSTPRGRFGTTDVTRADLSDLTELFLLLVAVIAIWDSADGILRARRRRSGDERHLAPSLDERELS